MFSSETFFIPTRIGVDFILLFIKVFDYVIFILQYLIAVTNINCENFAGGPCSSM
jgi:hypothetical protein